MSTYNRILLTEPPFFRKISERILSRDVSSLPFIIDELISYGVIDIAIPAHSILEMSLDVLPEALRKRVVVIDKKGEIREKSKIIYRPILEEFGLKEDHRGEIITVKTTSKDLERALSHLAFNLDHFLLGLEHKLQIDFDVDAMKTALAVIREHSKRPQTRSSLSALLGIISTYNPQTIGVIKMNSMAPERLVEVFEKFVDDAYYREISSEFQLLGFPEKLKSSITKIGDLSKLILTKPPFKNITNIAAKCITAATQIPVPVSDLGEALLQQKYLPPIVSLKDAISNAQIAWERAETDFISLDKKEKS